MGAKSTPTMRLPLGIVSAAIIAAGQYRGFVLLFSSQRNNGVLKGNIEYRRTDLTPGSRGGAKIQKHLALFEKAIFTIELY